MNLPLYFDFASTTPVHPAVVDKMLPYFSTQYGNAGSNQHYYGWQADEAVAESRAIIANYFQVRPNAVIFTSGATESNNLAIKGYLLNQKPSHIITSCIEHKAVLEVFRSLEELGWEVTYLMPNEFGEISPDQVSNHLKSNTCFISLMLVNNEIGTVLDYSSIKKIAQQHSICFHSDATQALGKIEIDASSLPDLLSFSAHKMYGPKGIGGLIVQPTVSLTGLFNGGGQERNIRSGTLPVQQIVGLAAAFKLIPEFLSKGIELKSFQKKIEDVFRSEFGVNLVLNSNSPTKIPHIINLTLKDVDWEKMFRSTAEIAYSNGSACNAKTTNPSHVLLALGHPNNHALSSMRLSLGYYTTKQEIDYLISYLTEKINRLIA